MREGGAYAAGKRREKTRGNIQDEVWFFPLIMAVTMGFIGVMFIYGAFHSAPNRAPDLHSTTIAAANQKAVGPTTATLNKEQVTPETMKPNRIFIPAINVYAAIDEVSGKVQQHELILPEASKVTRWQGGSGVMSGAGNLIIAGHVSWNGSPGALYNLAKTPLGAQAWVTDDEGNRQQFQLEKKEPYKKISLPASLWTKQGAKKLVTITCGGKLHLQGGAWHFDSNIVGVWHPVSGAVKNQD